MDHERPETLEAVVASPELSIADAISQLDTAGTGGLVLCRPDWQVAGLLTDGDIRRAVLRKVSLADPCGSIATPDPVVARAPIGPAEALQVMLQHDINHLPVVDEAGDWSTSCSARTSSSTCLGTCRPWSWPAASASASCR